MDKICNNYQKKLSGKGDYKVKDYGSIEKFKRKFDSDPTKTYLLYFPDDGHSPGVMYSPCGAFQIIDFVVAYDGKIITGNYTGDILQLNEIRELTEGEGCFFEILINMSHKHGGVLVENGKWMFSVEEETNGEFYILFRCIANISTGQVANIIFYNDPHKNGIVQGCNSDEKYDLLKNMLLYQER